MEFGSVPACCHFQLFADLPHILPASAQQQLPPLESPVHLRIFPEVFS